MMGPEGDAARLAVYGYIDTSSNEVVVALDNHAGGNSKRRTRPHDNADSDE